MTEHDLLTPEQAAKSLNISTKTLREHVKAGEIAYVALGKGEKRVRMRFDPKDILAFIDRRRMRYAPPEKPKLPAIKSKSPTPVIRFEDLPRPAPRKKRGP